jgi:hypothetical protein
MATTTLWKPSTEEIRSIVAELTPVIDECVRRSVAFLAGTTPQPTLVVTDHPR